MFKYLPHTHEDIRSMLKTIGVDSVDALFEDVPDSLKAIDLDVPESMSELELRRHFKALAAKNTPLIPFMGMGAYDHYTPSVINHLTNRQEFLTAYTPYQPEVSQGTLQYIFEYQSMISELTGMDVSNASMYDGATATAEAMYMAVNVRKKRRHIVVSETVNPVIRDVLEAYADNQAITLEVVGASAGISDVAALKEALKDDTAALIVQNPNVYGLIEDYEDLAITTKANKTLFVMNHDPSTLSHLKTPREWGADVAVGEAQSLGLPLSFGGPYIGYFATTEKLMRKMPGRICGVTEDVEGRRAFVLTLQAREQHIRRARANSNICSNQSLMALFVTIYLSIMGKKGLYEAQNISKNNAHYLHDMLLKLPHFEDPFDKPFFKEFTLKTTLDPNTMNKRLAQKGYLGPYHHGETDPAKEGLVTFSVTEKRTKEEMDDLIRELGAF
ncbi:MAG: aminomethyl-transferring glycine dehydrogenase subunit GcvPA [Bacillota bacterium]